ncbi:hypothetical protein [Humibacillus xanthopallidus]|uniref:Uncharacterized protein n=1 Tax=Humibacillus xanthopallidus TaxID=412689 RepID=A0A543HGC0_9MICO|nr:hypothetical protein [Humibacillus xanthopallidus]TQM57381.1 hypothetical protein FBY41_4205 [Humibacillus xanthopallidus]
MSNSALGALGLVVVVLLVAVLVLNWRRRPAESVITTGTARGRTGMAVHPWRGHPHIMVAGWLMVVGVAALGVMALGEFPWAAGLLLLGAALLAYLAWARTTGRAGDGTLTLTPDGIHQLYAGSEVFVPWDDVRGLVTTPTDFIVETTRPVVPVHHMLPFMGRRSVVTPEAIALPRRHLPPLPYQEMVELYSTSAAARDELGTDEAVHRARDLLTSAA